MQDRTDVWTYVAPKMMMDARATQQVVDGAYTTPASPWMSPSLRRDDR